MADKPKTEKADVSNAASNSPAPTAITKSTAKPQTGSKTVGASGCELIIRTFDEATGSPVTLDEGTQLTISPAGGNTINAKIGTSTAQGQLVLSDGRLPEGEATLTIDSEVNCKRLVSPPVSFCIQEGCECCAVLVPTTALDQTCTLTITTHDSSSQDFIQNAKGFLSGVLITVSIFETASGAKANFKAVTRSGRTKDGKFQLDVPMSRLCRIETQGPPNYSCDTPLIYLNICCEPTKDVQICLQPCEALHRMLFLRDCGTPWNGAPVKVGGKITKTEADGSLFVDDPNAAVEWPDKTFSLVSRDQKSLVSIFMVNDLAGTPLAGVPRRPSPVAELYREIYHELSFEGDVPEDVRVAAHTPDGEYLTDVQLDAATGTFRYPLSRPNEPVLFKATRKGVQFDQVLLGSGTDTE